MVWENLIFTDQNTDSLFEWGGFKTKYVSKIEADQVGDYTKCRKVLAELGMPDVSGYIKFKHLFTRYLGTYMFKIVRERPSNVVI